MAQADRSIPTRLPRARFRLRWLLMIVAVLGAVFAWMAPSIHRELAWRRAVAPIREAGGGVAWFADTHRIPENGAQIDLGNSTITDEQLRQLQEFPNAVSLILRNTQITDEGLKHVTALRSLQYVDLRGTQTTSAGIDMLKEALPETAVSR